MYDTIHGTAYERLGEVFFVGKFNYIYDNQDLIFIYSISKKCRYTQRDNYQEYISIES